MNKNNKINKKNLFPIFAIVGDKLTIVGWSDSYYNAILNNEKETKENG